MKNLKNWLNKNSFNFEVKEGFTGNELIFINVETLAAEQVKRIKTYLKRYKFTFEYRCNYTFILAYKEEEKIYKTIDNSIVQAATKENKINVLSNKEIKEYINILNQLEKGKDTHYYITFIKNVLGYKDIKELKENNQELLYKIRLHMVAYSSGDAWVNYCKYNNLSTREEAINHSRIELNKLKGVNNMNNIKLVYGKYLPCNISFEKSYCGSFYTCNFIIDEHFKSELFVTASNEGGNFTIITNGKYLDYRSKIEIEKYIQNKFNEFLNSNDNKSECQPDILICKHEGNTILSHNKHQEVDTIIPYFNYLSSMGIFKDLESKEQILISDYLKSIRSKYLENKAILKRIDYFINLSNNKINTDLQLLSSKTVKQSRVNAALERYNLSITRSRHFYEVIINKINNCTNEYLLKDYNNKKEEYEKDLIKSINDKLNFLNKLKEYKIIEDVEPAEELKNKLRPIYNSDIEGHEEYQKEQLKIYNSGNLNFMHKRINNKMIDEYTKYFVYKDNTFMSVKPGKDYPNGYYEHVRKYNYKIDHVNKIILFTDKEIEEVEPIKEEFYCNNKEVAPAQEVAPAEETEQEQQIREDKEYICDFIEEHRHIEKIDPFIENNKIEYFVSVQNYIQVFYTDKNNYNFNAVIQDYQFIRKNVDSLEVEGLIQSTFSIMKNYKNYKVIDHNFIKYGIDIFQCIDLSISDIKDIIRIDNIKDITIESDLITMYKDNEVIAEIDIKKDIPGLRKYTEEEQRELLRYYYDKLTESNINYYLIDSKVINQ